MSRRTNNTNTQGVVSNVIPPQSTARRRKPQKKGRLTTEKVGAMILNQALKDRTIKYLEVLITGTSVSTTYQQVDISAITQGASQNERVADTAWIERIDMSLGVTSANADVFNTARFVIIKWKESSQLALPTAADVFTNYPNALTHSFFNFEKRKLYSVIHDELISLTGVATSPTDTSQILSRKQIGLSSSRIDYDLAGTTGWNKLYFIFFSDSSALPFPVLNVNFRIWYYDE